MSIAIISTDELGMWIIPEWGICGDSIVANCEKVFDEKYADTDGAKC